ncbi:aromatic ring-hydroxylating oxygenase subunit alpha [Mycobacterium sp. 48b]|uniref:aromatic ring-hydroxylating oxygenase subunit alpha n=1 Tax=Mycobacterium sp. 48b TaxID=3400426 RepID=UPI003AAD931B
MKTAQYFAKPGAGSWTQNYPELGTAPVDYTDSIDPAHFEKEREAIFKRTWLNVGRLEQVAKKGSYFTREIAVLETSLVIVNSGEGGIRAFHNICRHRGNKLVWQDFPNEEVKGSCRQFTCKYHAWRYSLDGDLAFVQQEGEFFDLDKEKFGLRAVRCEVWEGFIFINLDQDAAPLADYLGPLAKGIEGYPYHEMTEVYRYSAEIGSNWKLFIDAFAEFYHAPVLHNKQYTKDEAAKIMAHGYEAVHYDLAHPHGMVSSGGGQSPPKNLDMVKPIDQILRSGLFGPWDKPDVDGLDPLPPGLNPGRYKHWGTDSFHFFPNFMLLFWEPGWYMTYHFWPTAVNRHVFEGTLYFAPPKNAQQRLAQELAVATFKEFALQDANTLEATQKMLQSRVIAEFPLCDQEILLRALHKSAHDYVKEYENGCATNTH